ncbi:hypothetical protein [Corynebacterium sp.]|uniref:hypothetical protein n=1 Tax=Corynebacterium sp. TaxID=1720 RepID=UPI0025BA9B15|nr:hypothetical protein [Corynebacterium sp.]
MTFGDMFFQDKPPSKKSRVRREVIQVPVHARFTGMFGKPSDEYRLAWTVYEPGKEVMCAAMGNYSDAMLYAQVVARRHLAKRWSA